MILFDPGRQATHRRAGRCRGQTSGARRQYLPPRTFVNGFDPWWFGRSYAFRRIFSAGADGDARETVLKESGDVILSNAKIHAEAGRSSPGLSRVPTGEPTVFKSVGIAIEDVAAARLVDQASLTRPGADGTAALLVVSLADSG